MIKAFNVDVGSTKRYEIGMSCLYLEPNGKVNKTTSLKSILKRTIKENHDNQLLFTQISWEDCMFQSAENAQWMKWKFPLEVKLEHNLFIAAEDELKNALFDGNAYNRADEHTESLTKAFAKLPKLPSVYLVIMQAFDMIGFESFTSFVLSNPKLFEKVGCYVESEALSYQRNSIGLGHYSADSFFKNGAFFFKYMGILMHGDKKAYALEYYCNGSEVSMGVAQGRGGKQGKSFYEGTLLIDVETGLPLYGTMHEHYLGSQAHKKEVVSSQVIRRIEMKELE